MTSKKSYLISLCLTFGIINGCQSWQPGEVAYVLIEDDFSTEQVAIIHEAIDQWEGGLDHYIQFQYVSSKGLSPLIVIRGLEKEELQAQFGDHLLGSTAYLPTEKGGGITVSTDISNSQFLRVVRHEVGHAIGLQHVHQSGMTMNPSIGHVGKSLICADVEQFCSVNDCWAKQMPICEDRDR